MWSTPAGHASKIGAYIANVAATEFTYIYDNIHYYVCQAIETESYLQRFLQIFFSLFPI